MSIEKIQFEHEEFSCMARFYEKKYQGVIWLSENDKGRIPPEYQNVLKRRIVGTSLEDVEQQIREQIDYVVDAMWRDSGGGTFDPLNGFKLLGLTEFPNSNIASSRYDENGIYYLGNYYPKTSGSNHDAYSKEILKLKNQKESFDWQHTWDVGTDWEQDYNSDRDRWFDFELRLATVPSSNSDTVVNGIHGLVQNWETQVDWEGISGPVDLFKRHTSIKSAHLGGDRSIEVHMNSIRIGPTFMEYIHSMDKEWKQFFFNTPLLIFDDVTTSGNSLLACRKIAAAAGFRDIHLCALGKTKRYRT